MITKLSEANFMLFVKKMREQGTNILSKSLSSESNPNDKELSQMLSFNSKHQYLALLFFALASLYF